MPAATAATSRRNGGRGVDGGDVMLIINHVDKRLGETESRIMAVIHEGHEAHGREHAAEIQPIKDRLIPLEYDLSCRQEAKNDRDARVEPLVRVATWATNHWQVALCLAGVAIVAISWAGHWLGI